LRQIVAVARELVLVTERVAAVDVADAVFTSLLNAAAMVLRHALEAFVAGESVADDRPVASVEAISTAVAIRTKTHGVPPVVSCAIVAAHVAPSTRCACSFDA